MQAAVVVVLLATMYAVVAKARRFRREEIDSSVDGPSASDLIQNERRKYASERLAESVAPLPPDDRFLRHHVRPPKNHRMH